MLTLEQEQQRISQLTRQDNQQDKQLDAYYDQVMSYIKEHLVTFYDHYALENQMTTAQAVQNVDSWGLREWKKAVDELEVSSWLPESKKRAEVLGNYAGFNNANLMSAIAGLAVIAMINKHVALVTDHIDNTVQDELDLMDNAFPNSIKQQNKPKMSGKSVPDHEKAGSTGKTAKKARLSALKYAKSNYAKTGLPDVSDRLWLDGDKLIDDVRSKLLNHFLRGGDLNGLNDILTQHANKGIADRIEQFNSISERLLRSESAMMLDYIDRYYYQQNNIKYVNWVTEPGACTLCLSLAAGSPYLLDEAPRLVIDSHPNCRCGKTPAMDANDKWNNEESKFKAMAKKHLVSKEEHDILYDQRFGYVATNTSSTIQDYLRDVPHSYSLPDEYMKTIKTMDRVISERTLPEPMEAYRYVDRASIASLQREINASSPQEFVNALNKGKYSYQDKAFTSTSLIEGKNLFNFKAIKFKYQLPKGTHGYVTDNYEESELLLARNVKYDVVSARLIQGGKMEIVLTPSK